MAAQNIFNKADVIYKVTQDVDLGATNLILRPGSIVDYQGGKLLNGSVNITDKSVTIMMR